MGDTRLAPYAVLGIGVVAVSWSAIIVREAEAPVLVIASYRMVLASMPVAALALIQQRRAPEPISRSTVGPLLLSAAFLAAHFGFWFASVKHTSVVTATVLVTTQPLFIAVAAPLLLGERVTQRIWFALFVALVGAAMMTVEDVGEGFGTLLGDLYGLLGGAFAGGYLMVGRWVRPTISWPRYVGTVYPITAVLLLSATLIAREPFTGYSTMTYVMMALLALGPQLIGHNAINWSLGYLPVVVVAMAILGEPVGATVWAALILDEQPSMLELAGGVVVLLGVYLGLRPEQEAVPAATGPPQIGEE